MARSTSMFKKGVTLTDAKRKTASNLKKNKRLNFKGFKSFRKIKSLRNDAGQDINVFEGTY